MRSPRLFHFATVRTALAAFLLLFAAASAAATERVVYNFTGGSDGGNAATQVVFDSLGNAYGTTVQGGAFGCGTVFKLQPTTSGQWKETVLWNFSCFGDGKNPHGGVVLHDNALYGTTVAGGNSNSVCTGDGCGVVFRVDMQRNEQVLYNFQGGNDGFGPGSPVIFDRHGDIFGTTPDGGTRQQGTVYELVHGTTGYSKKTIHNFTGGFDGGTGSLGALHLGPEGNLYGVTETGGLIDGNPAAGTAYRLSQKPDGTWYFTLLYTFAGQPDAGFPYGGLIADAQGNLYGTTYFGGASGVGSVYELSPMLSGRYSERVLYSFKGGTDGSSPTSTLLLNSRGDLFGTTSAGGRPSCDCGTVFRLDHMTGLESIVHRFGVAPDGSFPYYGLTLHVGNLYSSTNFGGLDGQGTIFGLSP